MGGQSGGGTLDLMQFMPSAHHGLTLTPAPTLTLTLTPTSTGPAHAGPDAVHADVGLGVELGLLQAFLARIGALKMLTGWDSRTQVLPRPQPTPPDLTLNLPLTLTQDPQSTARSEGCMSALPHRCRQRPPWTSNVVDTRGVRLSGVGLRLRLGLGLQLRSG